VAALALVEAVLGDWRLSVKRIAGFGVELNRPSVQTAAAIVAREETNAFMSNAIQKSPAAPLRKRDTAMP